MELATTTDRTTTRSARFAEHLSHDVSRLQSDPELLSVTGERRLPTSAARESIQLRDAFQSLLDPTTDRSLVKMGFLWHKEYADIFCDTVVESLSRAGVVAHNLAIDIQGRARSFAKALGVSCVSIDLLCSRFRGDAAPVHVDYGELLQQGDDGSSSPLNDHRAFSFIMPYSGEGTQYLSHPRSLTERRLREAIISSGQSKDALSQFLSEQMDMASAEWISTSSTSYTIHRNGLAIHRSPSSDDCRLVLAIDGCVPATAFGNPLLCIRERIIRNERAVRALRAAHG